jgi:hypothetical protein
VDYCPVVLDDELDELLDDVVAAPVYFASALP